MRRALAVSAVATGLTLAAASPAAAHVTLNEFTLTPSCVTPGGSVDARVTITQNHWYHVHNVYARVQVRNPQTGLVLSQSDDGPQRAPFGRYTSSRSQTVPPDTPYGEYQVVLRLGSTLGGSDWGTAARPLSVRISPLFC